MRANSAMWKWPDWPQKCICARRSTPRPNRKFVSASTREYAYAQYLRAWVDRAERVGSLNYPDEARQRRLVTRW